MEDLKIIIIEDFINNADDLFQQIGKSVKWDERIKARKTASFGVAYNYSGITYPEIPMMACLIPICQKIESQLGFLPNNCLMNYYLDGNSKMGYHSDSAEKFKKDTGVAILSCRASHYISK